MANLQEFHPHLPWARTGWQTAQALHRYLRGQADLE